MVQFARDVKRFVYPKPLLINKVSIKLPRNHMLPVYLHRHNYYDRFLPYLVSKITESGLIVDVGANVGDTLVAMATENPDLHYLCIEADPEFFQYLEINTGRLRKHFPNIRIRLEQEFVGFNVDDVSLAGKFGTKHANFSPKLGMQIFSSKPLDVILKRFEWMGEVLLIKSDVDGFDWDVIDSGMNTVKESFPILFFEVAVFESSQLASYKNTLESLAHIGYDFWAIFDNFGQIIFQTKNIDTVSQMIEYLDRIRTDQRNRTIYYFDVLASTQKHASFLSMQIDEYLK